MVAFVSGNGLGLFNTSLDLIGKQSSTGNATAGRSGEQAFVNTATGNLVIERQDEVLKGLGSDIGMVRTYNSLGLMNDDNGDNWRMGVVKSLGSLTGAINAAGSTITRTEGDGATQLFTFDVSRNAYVSQDGSGAFDLLSYDSATSSWSWTDGASGRKETFDWNGSSGKLTAAFDTDGNKTSYTYAGNLLASVTTASGETTYLDYVGTNLADVRTVKADGTSLTRVRYSYDASNRLETVTVDLTPDDNSVADGKTYTTTYTYDGTSRRIASITQLDGSKVSFGYQLVDGSYRVNRIAQLVDGAERVTALTYDTVARKTTVTDPLGNATVHSYDAAGRLVNLKGPTSESGKVQEVSYSYDGAGNLTSQTDGRGNVITYGYDGNGNQVLQRDAAGNTITRTYSGKNELLTETLYQLPDPDGSGAATAGEPKTTRYVYDGESHLRFAVTADGRVTEYQYNEVGTRKSSIEYAGQLYNLSGLATDASVSLSTMTAWTGAIADKSKTIRTDYTYDFRGLLKDTVYYASVDASGIGMATGSSTTRYVYGQAGQLVKTISAKGVVAADGSGATVYTYDGLGRVLTTTTPDTRQTVNLYDDAASATKMLLANGLTTTYAYNGAGELVSALQSDGTTALGTTTYQYDNAGRLRMMQDPTGVKRYYLYDAAGNKVADIDADGSLTEYRYNSNGQRITSVSYATAVSATALASLTVAGKPANVTLASIRPATHALDGYVWNLYDNANRLAKTVDAKGYVVETQYDGQSRVVATVAYATRFAGAITATTKPEDVVPATDATADRRSRMFYDADGHMIGTLDAEGYLSTSEYDGAGRLIHTLRFATRSNAAAWASGTLSDLKPSASTSDIHEWRYYDGQDRLLAVVDGEGYVTENGYDANGNLTRQVRYNNPSKIAITSIDATTTLDMLRPVVHVKDQVSLWSYTDLNQVQAATDAYGTVTRYTYDEVGQVKQTDRAWNTTDLRTLRLQYDKQGRVTAELNGEGSAALVALPVSATQAQIDAIWTQYGTRHQYDAAGRKTATIDANNNKTLYYYNTDGQLVYQINAAGEVSENVYNALEQLQRQTRYGTRLSAATLAGLSGGLITAGVTSTVSALANVQVDSTVSYTYDIRGLVESRTDEMGNASIKAFNAFGELTDSVDKLDATSTVRTRYAYDRRGLQTTVTDDALGAMERVTQRRIYDAFGRIADSFDAKQLKSTVQYDRLGRVIQTWNALNVGIKTEYDAFGRAVKQTDAGGHTTAITYDDVAHSRTVTTAENVSVTTTQNRHGQTLTVKDGNGNVTSYEYDKNGDLKKQIDGAGAISNNYDVSGRLYETVDANGTVTRYGYDKANRVLSRMVDPNGLKLETTYVYDAKGQSVRVVTNGVVTAHEYDAKGRVMAVIQDPDGLKLRTEYKYDERDQLVTVTEGAGGGAPKVTKYLYDRLGRRTEEQVVLSATVNLSTKYTYDSNDNVVARTDANGNVTRYVYDDANRVQYEVDPMGGVTKYAYTAEGKRAGTTRYVFTVAIAKTTQALTASDITAVLRTDASSDNVVSYFYDNDDRLRFEVDGTRAVTEYRYDGNGNVLRNIRYSKSLPTTTMFTTEAIAAKLAEPGFKDAAKDAITVNVYDAANRLTRQIDGAGAVVAYTYDGNGNVLDRIDYATRLSDADRAKLNLSWFVPGLPAEDKAHDQHVKMVYDAANRLTYSATAVKVSGTGQLQWSVVGQTYDTNGNVASRTQYATFLSSAALGTNPTQASIATWAGTVQKNPSADKTTRLFYDGAGRQTMTASTTGTSTNGLIQWALTSQRYDALGNGISTTSHGKTITLTEGSLPDAAQVGTIVNSFDASVDRRTVTVYDNAARPAFQFDALGYATELSYDGTGNAVTVRRYSNALDVGTLSNTWSVDGIRGLLIPNSISDRVERRVFDENGRLAYSINAAGYVSKTAYDAIGQVRATVQYTKRLGSDVAVNALAIETAIGSNPSDLRTTTYSYDASGHVTGLTDATGYTETYTYDALGRKLSFKNKNGAVWNYEYDAAGNLTAEITPEVPVTYVPPAGAVGPGTNSGVTQMIRIRTNMEYDAFGHVTARIEGVGQPEARITHYEYDAAGHQVKIINHLVSVYDAAADQYTVNGASGNAAWTEKLVTPTVIVTYDALGNAIVNQDVGGKLSYKVYDQTGQVRYEIDANRYVTGYVRNSFGEVTSVTRYANAMPSSPYFDSLGEGGMTLARVDAFLQAPVDHSADRVVRTEYDQLGRVKKVIEPQVMVFDQSGKTGAFFAASKTTERIYNPFGDLLQQKVYGQTSDGNVATNVADTYYKYDALGRKIAEAVEKADKIGYLTTYSYDAVGNLIEQTEYAVEVGFSDTLNPSTGIDYGMPPASDNDRKVVYSYDRNNRKASETRFHVKYSPTAGQETWGDLHSVYYYDAVGNMTKTVDSAGTIGYTYYDALGRITAQATVPLKKLQSQVTQLYLAILNRGPDKTGLDYHVTQLRNGATLEQIADSIDRSVEATQLRGTSSQDNASFIASLYSNMLNRPVDAEGMAWYTSLMQPPSSFSRAKVIVTFIEAVSQVLNTDTVLVNEKVSAVLDSALQGNENIDHARWLAAHTAAVSNRRMQIAELYMAILGRVPEAGGLQGWVDSPHSIEQIAQSIYDSPEAMELYPERADVGLMVTRLYQTVYGHAIDSANLTYWLQQRQSSATAGQFVTKLIAAVKGAPSSDPVASVSRNHFFHKVAAALPGGMDLNTANSPFTEFKRDVYGNVVQRTDYAGGALALNDAYYQAPQTRADDRVSYSFYDVYGHAIRQTDALGRSSFASYDEFGRLAKEWQTVTDVAPTDGSTPRQRTSFKIMRYDAVGQLVEVIAPGAVNVVQGVNGVGTVFDYGPASTTVDSFRTQYNAFGEVTARSLNGEGAYEYYDYNNAGQLWRTNAGDGVHRVALYDIQGHQTSEIKSATLNLKTAAIASTKDVFYSTDTIRTDYTVDMLGNVLFQHNGAVAVTQDVLATQLSLLYVALLNRAPDLHGMTFYLDQMRNGTQLSAIAQQILNSPEAQTPALYAGLSGAGFVARVFKIALGIDVGGNLSDPRIARWAPEFPSDQSVWPVNLVRMLQELAYSTGGSDQDYFARALLRNKMSVGMAYAATGGGYDTNEASQLISLVTATDTSQAQKIVNRALFRNQVTQLYVTLLDRAPERAGLDNQVNTLLAGADIYAIAQNIYQSTEGQTIYGGSISNEEFVRRFYKTAIDREPDTVGLKFWVDALNGGLSRGAVAFEIGKGMLNYAGSDANTLDAKRLISNKVAIGLMYAQYAGGNDSNVATAINNAVESRISAAEALKAAVATLNSASSVAAANAQSTTQAAAATPVEQRRVEIAQLYAALLNRAPDLSGLNYYVNMLLNGGPALNVIADSLYGSTEGQAIYPATLTNEQFITKLYQTALGRTPDAAGLNYWLSTFTPGRSRGTVALDVLYSALHYTGTDPLQIASRDLLNNKIAVGLTYALDMGGNEVDPANAKAIIGLVTATDTSAALNKAITVIKQSASAAALTTAADVSTASGKALAETNVATAQTAAANAANTAAATYSNIASDRYTLVTRLYLGVLNRNPDLAGLNGWVANAASGMSMVDIAASFLNSQEGQAMYWPGLTAQQFVDRVYQIVVGRSADANGLSFWSTAIANGTSRASALWSIMDGFLNNTQMSSSDMRLRANFYDKTSYALAVNRNASAGTASYSDLSTAATKGSADSQAASTRATWFESLDTFAATPSTDASKKYAVLTTIFIGTVNRGADLTALNYWYEKLKTKSYPEIAQEMLNSNEARGIYPTSLTNDQFVGKVYSIVFGRTIDSAGLSTWSGQLSSGKTRGEVLYNITQSLLGYNGTDAPELQRKSNFAKRISDSLVSAKVSADAAKDPTVAYTNAVTAKSGEARTTAASWTPALSTAASNRLTTSRVYSLVLGRAPTLVELNGDYVKAPVDVAASLFNSAEGLARYPSSMTAASFITKLFTDMLGRSPDSATLTTWTNQLATKSRGQVAVDLLNNVLGYSGTDVAALMSRSLLINKALVNLVDVANAANAAASAAASAANGINSVDAVPVDPIVGLDPSSDVMTAPNPLIDASGIWQKFDRWGNLVETKDPRNWNLVTRYSYNANNQLLGTDRADGNSLVHNYYDQRGQLIATRDANGFVNEQKYDVNGNLVLEIHADGGMVHHQYNTFGQRIRSLQANGVLTDYAYDHLGHLVSSTQAVGVGVAVYGSSVAINPADQTGVVSAALQGYQSLREEFWYDEMGRRIMYKNAAGEIQKFFYNLRGDVVRTINAAGQTTRYVYDAFGHKTFEQQNDGRSLYWTVDAFGTLQSHLDMGGKLTEYYYDQLRQVTVQTSKRPAYGNQYTQVLRYTHDRQGRLTEIQDDGNGRKTQYAYDQAGNRTLERTTQTRVDSTGTYYDVLQDNRIVFDSLNRISTVENKAFEGSSLEYGYDANGNRTYVRTRYVEGGEAKYVIYWNKFDSMNRQVVVDGINLGNGPEISTWQGQRIMYDNSGNRIMMQQYGDKLVGTTGHVDAYYNLVEGEWVLVNPARDWIDWSTQKGYVTETYSYDAANRLTDVYRDGLDVEARRLDAAGRVISQGVAAPPDGRSLPAIAAALRQAGVNTDTQTNHYGINGQLDYQSLRDATGFNRNNIQYQYDGVSRLTAYQMSSAPTASAYFDTHFYTYSYEYGDSARVREVNVTRHIRGDNIPEQHITGKVITNYDANDNVAQVIDTVTGANTRELLNDAEGRVLQKTQNGFKTTSFIVNGELIGSNSSNVKEVDTFGSSYVAVTDSSQTAGPTTRTVQAGETLQSIAKAVWGNPALWYLIADANGVSEVKEGDIIVIPSRTNALYNSSQTFRAYDSAAAIGDTTPTTAAPVVVQPKKKGGLFRKILVAVVAIAATVFTAGVAAVAMSTAAASTSFMSAGLAALTSNVTAAAIGGAVGSIASQGVSMALGMQDSFSWKGVAMGAIGAAATAGVGYALPVSPGTTLSAYELAGRAALANVASQGIQVATGLQEHFSWAGVAAAAVGAWAGSTVSSGMEQAMGKQLTATFGRFGGDLVRGTVAGVAAGTTAKLFAGGKIDFAQVATDAFGNALGNSIAEAMKPQEPGLGNTFAADMEIRKKQNYWNPDSGNYGDEMNRLKMQAAGELGIAGTVSSVSRGVFASSGDGGNEGPALYVAPLSNINNVDPLNSSVSTSRVNLSYPEMYPLPSINGQTALTESRATHDPHGNVAGIEYVSVDNQPAMGYSDQMRNALAATGQILWGGIKGLVNGVPATITMAGKGYAYLGAQIGESAGVLSAGATGRMIDALEPVTGRVFDYDNGLQSIGGIAGEMASPGTYVKGATLGFAGMRALGPTFDIAAENFMASQGLLLRAKGSGSSTTISSSRLLGEALEAAGDVRYAESAAHHMVAGTAQAAKPARSVLNQFGIGINTAENGVFLPQNLAAPNPLGAAVHSKVHTREYYETVNEIMRQATTRQEALEALSVIKQTLLNGGFK